MNDRTFLALCTLAALALPGAGGAPAPVDRAPRPLAFERLQLHLEVDLPAPGRGGRDGLRRGSILDLDAELVFEAESPVALRHLRVLDSSNATILEIACPSAPLAALAELSFECEEVPLGRALAEYPAGEYRVEGTAVSGAPVRGTAHLSHEFPGPVAVLAPHPAEVVAGGDVEFSWTAAGGAARYVLEVEEPGGDFSLELELPRSRTRVTLPGALLGADRRYEYSLAVQGDTDNELEVEGAFVTAPALR